MNEKDRKIFNAVLGNPPIRGFKAVPAETTVEELLKEANIKLYKGNFTIEGSSVDKSGTTVLHIHGGNNGIPDWPMYLKQLSKIMTAIPGSWLIKLVNDCPDDVFDCYIGIPDGIAV